MTLDALGLKQAEADRRAKGKLAQSPSQPRTTDGDGGVRMPYNAHNLKMKITINKNGEPRKQIYPWNSVDWEQPTSVIAEQLGVGQTTVYRARKRYAEKTVGRYRIITAIMKDWADGIDWSKSDIVIARETGRRPSSVWKTRKTISRNS